MKNKKKNDEKFQKNSRFSQTNVSCDSAVNLTNKDDIVILAPKIDIEILEEKEMNRVKCSITRNSMCDEKHNIKNCAGINSPCVKSSGNQRLMKHAENAPSSSGYDSGNITSHSLRSDRHGDVPLTRQSFIGGEGASKEILEKLESRDEKAYKKTRRLTGIKKKNLPWEIYTNRFPQAKRNMETKLAEFIYHYLPSKLENRQLNPVERFAVTQIVELAQSLYKKSLDIRQKIDSKYFSEILSALEALHKEAEEKCSTHLILVPEVIHKLYLLMSRPARLLECLELQPTKFYNLVEQEKTLAELRNRNFNLTEYIKDRVSVGPNMDYEKECSKKNLEGTFSSLHHGLWIVQKEIVDFDSSTVGIKDDTFNSSASSSCETDSSLLPSETDFEEIKLISQGAYGAVYLVRHKTTHDRYALKKINKNHALLKNQINQIFAERDILSFTENPFVVSMYCSFETHRNFCMVMEYVEGGDCSSLLKNIGVFPVEMARMYSAELLLAVEYIHNYGIIHRDIKPDNILITAFGHIKLTDFGLSKVGMMNMTTHLIEDYIGEFHDDQVLGTPDYIAPEVIMNKPYGRAIDYWSIGVVLYEFLVGCTPFYGDSPEELFQNILTGPIEWPQDDEKLPDDCVDIVSKLLNRDPTLRIGLLGASELKEHCFFESIEWNKLLRQKSEFVPNLRTDDDTSYFDTRTDRHSHHLDSERHDETYSSLPDSFCFTSSTKRFQNTMERADNNALQFSPPPIAFEKIQETKKRSSSPLLSSENPQISTGSTIGSFPIPDLGTPELLRQTDFRLKKESITTPLQRSDSHNAISAIRTSRNDNLCGFISTPCIYPIKQPLKSVSVEYNPQQTIVIKKTLKEKSFGFTLKAIRVRSTTQNTFVLYHMIDNILPNSPAENLNLKSGDILTHINRKPIDGLTHVQVVRLLYKDPKEAKLCISSCTELGISVKNISSKNQESYISSNVVPVWRESTGSSDYSLLSPPDSNSIVEKKLDHVERKKRFALKKIKEFFTKPTRMRKKQDSTVLQETSRIRNQNSRPCPDIFPSVKIGKKYTVGSVPISPLVLDHVSRQNSEENEYYDKNSNPERFSSIESDSCAFNSRNKQPYEYRMLTQTVSSMIGSDKNYRTSQLEVNHKVGPDVYRKIRSLESSINSSQKPED